MRSILLYSTLLLISSCSNRTDIVFSAHDELHSLNLYEQDKVFEMLYNGMNTVEGQYYFKNDTIFLTYASEETVGSYPKLPAAQVLTTMIAVNINRNRIRSLNGMPFCGTIGINKLN
jgi:hypothetical protein